MKKHFVFGLMAFVALAMMSFSYLTPAEPDGLEEMSMEELSKIHEGDFERMSDHLNVDKILDVQTTALEDGSYSVEVKTYNNGTVATQTFTALDYSAFHSCLCYGCDEWAPYGNAYKKKVVIGTKCWCVYCPAEEPVEPVRN